MKLATRPATDKDKPFARDIHHSAYRDVVIRQFGKWEETLQDQFFDNDWASSDFCIIMVDGQSCGYAAVEERDLDIHIRELVIHPDQQGRGLGTAFLITQIDRAKKRNTPIRLGTFLQNRAVELYRRLGFQEFDRTDTHILMEWK